MQLNDVLGYRQPKPRTLIASGAVGFVEALEEVRQMLRRDAGAAVAYLDEDAVPLRVVRAQLYGLRRAE